ncbi:precorrin-2 C(20)-methyltransferase [Thermosipho melanesiensis]|uniref:Uroporphyrin-III C/tetrapyrrole (Corrin/Porphyrin) methyltransferase n=1 Tax=Thermosipho melanesiensis (strain DSM 12029 / CIP 104789 / BI429) TaxID=391009 RepID=A6LKW4_THEM4|nr:precorrin-2 C(20)-methyltransferase [Thermosipho melanesiensis]ABR30565.1 Uroporphyrin-III C/tetrapyrrole (Corrin/Porphyrin) methyltransferase [Thermosipho melanesiensis BI429]
MKLILFGIGVLPENLITKKAQEILQSTNYIFCPKTESGSIAYDIVKKYTNEKIEFLEISMKERKKVDISKIVEQLKEEKDVAFVTIGDPNLYSTYIYIAREVEKIGFKTQTIPAVNSISYAASKLNIPISIKNEGVAIVPGTNLELLKKASKIFDNIVILKPKNLEKIKDVLVDFNTFVAEKLGTLEEKTYNFLPEKLPYMSIIMAKRREK